MINYILGLLAQPSTYAGLAGLALAGGVSEAVTTAGAAAAAAVFSFIAVVLNERKAK